MRAPWRSCSCRGSLSRLSRVRAARAVSSHVHGRTHQELLFRLWILGVVGTCLDGRLARPWERLYERLCEWCLFSSRSGLGSCAIEDPHGVDKTLSISSPDSKMEAISQPQQVNPAVIGSHGAKKTVLARSNDHPDCQVKAENGRDVALGHPSLEGHQRIGQMNSDEPHVQDQAGGYVDESVLRGDGIGAGGWPPRRESARMPGSLAFRPEIVLHPVAPQDIKASRHHEQRCRCRAPSLSDDQPAPACVGPEVLEWQKETRRKES